MFTGIIETTGKVQKIVNQGSNKTLSIASDIWDQLKIDQSLAHNGVCLTVTNIEDGLYDVTLIKESLDKSNFDRIAEGDIVNLERAMTLNQRLDGHIVQGHVDSIGTILDITPQEGSFLYTIQFPLKYDKLVIDKGSICINGISLTVISPQETTFQVAIIPYTYAHTNLYMLKPGDKVNIEFDILGKYLQRHIRKNLDNSK